MKLFLLDAAQSVLDLLRWTFVLDTKGLKRKKMVNTRPTEVMTKNFLLNQESGKVSSRTSRTKQSMKDLKSHSEHRVNAAKGPGNMNRANIHPNTTHRNY